MPYSVNTFNQVMYS